MKICGKAQFPHSFGRSTETMRNLCLSTKFPNQKIRWKYGIFCRANYRYSPPLVTIIWLSVFIYIFKICLVWKITIPSFKIFSEGNLVIRHTMVENVQDWYTIHLVMKQVIMRSFKSNGAQKSVPELQVLKKLWGIWLLSLPISSTYIFEQVSDASDARIPRDNDDIRKSLWYLTLSWRRPLSYRNQSIDLLGKSMDWFLYDNGLRHERVKTRITIYWR